MYSVTENVFSYVQPCCVSVSPHQFLNSVLFCVPNHLQLLTSSFTMAWLLRSCSLVLLKWDCSSPTQSFLNSCPEREWCSGWLAQEGWRFIFYKLLLTTAQQYQSHTSGQSQQEFKTERDLFLLLHPPPPFFLVGLLFQDTPSCLCFADRCCPSSSHLPGNGTLACCSCRQEHQKEILSWSYCSDWWCADYHHQHHSPGTALHNNISFGIY